MNKDILFQDENHLHDEVRKNFDDLEWIEEFYKFLQGEPPENIIPRLGRQPKMTQKKAFTIIWYLQEHMRILPDGIERCDTCGDLYDSYSEGIYWQSKGKFFCGGCDHLVPQNYDNNKW